jgi:hypothetical protein
MQAILNSKHQRFCNWLKDVKTRQLIDDKELATLEKEMEQFYEIYRQKREDIRKIIFAYEERQQNIRNRIKRYRHRSSIPSQSKNGLSDTQLIS